MMPATAVRATIMAVDRVTPIFYSVDTYQTVGERRNIVNCGVTSRAGGTLVERVSDVEGRRFRPRSQIWQTR